MVQVLFGVRPVTHSSHRREPLRDQVCDEAVGMWRQRPCLQGTWDHMLITMQDRNEKPSKKLKKKVRWEFTLSGG